MKNRTCYYRKICVCTCVLLIGTVQAQTVDRRTELWLALSGNVALLNDILPYHHYFNNGGRWTNDKAQLLQRAGVHHTRNLGNFNVQVGGEGYVRSKVSETYLQQVYLVANYRKLQMIVGKIQENSLFRPHPPVSLGDVGISDNAPAIPRIGLQLNDYMDIRCLHGWVAVHGSLYHGRLAKERYISRAFWHQKSSHIRVRQPQKNWSFIFGLRHYAIWGGAYPNGVPIHKNALLSYYKVFFAAPLEDINASGSHIGTWDLACQYQTATTEWQLYGQKVFEDNQSKRDGLDGILGLRFQTRGTQSWIERIQFEILSTTYQGGPGLPDPQPDHRTIEENYGYGFGGRDNLYNNYLYRSGYTFRNFVIGVPLPMTRERAQELNLPLRFEDYTLSRIFNSRIRAQHISAHLRLNAQLNVQLGMIHTVNYGTYFGKYGGRLNWQGEKTDPDYFYYFSPAKRQFYTHIAAAYTLNNAWTATLSLAADSGQIYHSGGLQASMRYQIY